MLVSVRVTVRCVEVAGVVEARVRFPVGYRALVAVEMVVSREELLADEEGEVEELEERDDPDDCDEADSAVDGEVDAPCAGIVNVPIPLTATGTSPFDAVTWMVVLPEFTATSTTAADTVTSGDRGKKALSTFLFEKDSLWNSFRLIVLVGARMLVSCLDSFCLFAGGSITDCSCCLCDSDRSYWA